MTQNANPTTGVRYGVIACNSLDQDLVDTLFYGSQATNVSEEEAAAEAERAEFIKANKVRAYRITAPGKENRAHNVGVFCQVYPEKLLQAVIDDPATYGLNVKQVPVVAEKMRLSFIVGGYSHQGNAIKATCRHFGIKHTRTAMEEFFEKPVEVAA